MKALVALSLSRHLWGHTPHSTRHYRVANQTHIRGEEHYDSDRRTAVRLPERTFLQSVQNYCRVQPVYSIGTGAKRPGFKLNTDLPLPHWFTQSGAYANTTFYLLRLTLGLGAAELSA